MLYLSMQEDLKKGGKVVITIVSELQEKAEFIVFVEDLKTLYYIRVVQKLKDLDLILN